MAARAFSISRNKQSSSAVANDALLLAIASSYSAICTCVSTALEAGGGQSGNLGDAALEDVVENGGYGEEKRILMPSVERLQTGSLASQAWFEHMCQLRMSLIVSGSDGRVDGAGIQ